MKPTKKEKADSGSKRYGSIPRVTHEAGADADDAATSVLPFEDEACSSRSNRSRIFLLTTVVAAASFWALAALTGHYDPDSATASFMFRSPSSASSSRHDHRHQGLEKRSHGSNSKKDIKKSPFLTDPKLDETALLYEDQFVDHINYDTEHFKHKIPTYKQRYYKKSRHWKGPGYPILVILGGEDALELPILYPFVHEGLASLFGAFVLSPEHRYVRGVVP